MSVAPGQTFSLVRECDRYRSLYYAGASGDFNPIHIDVEVGQAAGLGGLILQGLCTLAWAVDAFARFLDISIKSTTETEYNVLTARDLGFLSEELFRELTAEVIEIRRMIYGFRRRLLGDK